MVQRTVFGSRVGYGKHWVQHVPYEWYDYIVSKGDLIGRNMLTNFNLLSAVLHEQSHS